MSVAIPLDVIDELAELLGRDAVLSAHSDLIVFECDGFVIEKNCPDVVVFPAIDRAGGRRRAALQSRTACRSCRAVPAPAWPAAACRSAAA